MSYALMAEIRCNERTDEGIEPCFEAHAWYGNVGEVRDHARQAGWQTNAPGGRDYCPEHRKSKSRGQAA